MVFKKIGRKIGYVLGRTKETRIELSDIAYEEAVVYKRHVPGEDEPAAFGAAMGNAGDEMAMGYVMHRDEEYRVIFRGQHEHFVRDDAHLFHSFENGDNVKVGYRAAQKVTYDYVPPDFESKQEVGRVPADSVFVSVERID